MTRFGHCIVSIVSSRNRKTGNHGHLVIHIRIDDIDGCTMSALMFDLVSKVLAVILGDLDR